jgi:hypothetical protein
MKNFAFFVSAVISQFVIARSCISGDLLFERASRNYNREGIVGEAYRREFESRMFTHSEWLQRLYYEAPDGGANETFEIYVAPDGSHRLSYRRAEPALSPLIRSRPQPNQRMELAKNLSRISIKTRDVDLPPEVATELEHLWRTMVPGVALGPVSQVFPVHAPTFIAFVREKHLIEAGTVCIAAYDTKAYRLFVDLVSDLKKLSVGRSRSAVVPLRATVQQLTLRLAK